ncbi:MAG: head-tail connector protein [Peptococcaceae bacterium]|nr:head-tail connector protein [Peptococcaceae bacterium]
MAELTVDEIKTYCRIDGDADDAEIINVFLPAAEHYLDAAIDHKAVLSYDVPQYRLLVLLLINHWYNNRDSVAVGVSVAEMPFLWRNLMQQLQNWGEDA